LDVLPLGSLVVGLEVDWAEVVGLGVKAFAVVELVNVVCHGVVSACEVFPYAALNKFPFECSAE
jgi:hypothetical protein